MDRLIDMLSSLCGPDLRKSLKDLEVIDATRPAHYFLDSWIANLNSQKENNEEKSWDGMRYVQCIAPVFSDFWIEASAPMLYLPQTSQDYGVPKNWRDLPWLPVRWGAMLQYSTVHNSDADDWASWHESLEEAFKDEEYVEDNKRCGYKFTSPDDFRWLLNMYLWLEYEGLYNTVTDEKIHIPLPDLGMASMSIPVSGLGEPMEYDWAVVDNWMGLELPKADDANRFMKAFTYHLSLTLLFGVSLMHCRNVKQIKASLNRAERKRRANLTDDFSEVVMPSVNYTIIDVDPVRTIYKHEDGSPRDLSQAHKDMKKHLVQGHFADYRTGPGLFGRWNPKNKIWIKDHHRGNLAYGVSDHDYKVASGISPKTMSKMLR